MSDRYEYLKETLENISAPAMFDSHLKPKECEIEEKLACCHVTAADLAKVRQEIKEMEILSRKISDNAPAADIAKLQSRLQTYTAQCNECITECQAKMAGLRDLTVFVNDELQWLRETQIAITAPQSGFEIENFSFSGFRSEFPVFRFSNRNFGSEFPNRNSNYINF